MNFEDIFRIDSNSVVLVLGTFVVIYILLGIRARRLNPSRLPVFNDRKWFEFGYGKATKRYISDPEGMLRSGFRHVRTASPMQSLLIMAKIAWLEIGRRCILLVHRSTFPLDIKSEICRCNWS